MTEQTVLLVGHGSREPGGNDEINAFAQAWRQQRPNWRIEVCFIEFAPVLLDAGLDAAARGSQRVVVVPLILNAAGHVKMDVPDAIAHARERHPAVAFAYTPHLGACDPILAVLRRQLRQVMQRLDMPDPVTTGVILLARGSSDRQANGDVARMARWLHEAGDHELVDIAFTGITLPRLERVVQRQERLGMTQIVVLPYYLFTGTLMTRIQRQIQHLQGQYPRLRFGLGDYFGFEPEITALLEERVQATTQPQSSAMALMPCDGCKFREIAAAHGHGPHHHGPDEHAHGHDHAHPHPHP
ncbi:sirohydrochlorin chelatase [Amphibiibacter pelophylacis]|uniref:Sirohydrochlorin chelatase n=1 Tax=Amphibiibacter pelophylacis TaxID=1799477 RepID=A0ACC6NYF0_9BURK